MSFWNNPENNSYKAILIVAVVAVLGYFVYTYMNANSLGGQGRVISTPSATTETTPIGGTDMAACKIEKTDLIPGPGCAQVNADCTITKISDLACNETGSTSMKTGAQTTTRTEVGTTDRVICKVEVKRTAAGDCIEIQRDCSTKPSTGCTPPVEKETI